MVETDDMGTLERIWLKRAHRGLMDPVLTGTLDADKGLRGSANYGGRRHVTIVSRERWAEMMDVLDADVDPSARRANLLVSGVEFVETRDRLLRVGGCLLRIGRETRPCERMEEAHRGLQAVMRERWGGGAWAVVVEGGEISVGDTVDWMP
jgi:MOSC domain-containing protein YiiM